MKNKLDTKKLDEIVKAVENEYQIELDFDCDQDGYFLCSKTRSKILEDEYMIGSTKLTDEEHDYCEDQLNTLQKEDDDKDNPYI